MAALPKIINKKYFKFLHYQQMLHDEKVELIHKDVIELELKHPDELALVRSYNVVVVIVEAYDVHK